MTKQALILNASHPQYNLGCEKLSRWLIRSGWTVERDCRSLPLFAGMWDLVAISAIFSWDVPKVIEWANQHRNTEVWIGGPAASFCYQEIADKTGIEPRRGLDPRFEQEPGEYKYVYTSRGCPEECWFCPVWKIEGSEFTLYEDWNPGPMLCDNNLTDLPLKHQASVVGRYKEWGRRFDANSGFEPKNFDRRRFDIWSSSRMSGWRLGFDEVSESYQVERMIRNLRSWGVPQSRIWVYCMIGHEPIADCYQRAHSIVEWGGMPKVQPFIPLAQRTKTPTIRHDWTLTKLRAFAKFYWHCHWKRRDLWEWQYKSGIRPFDRAEVA